MQARQLTLPAYVLIISGLFTAIATLPPLRPALVAFVDLAFWPLDGSPEALDRVDLLVAAIAGGLMAGWGVFILMIARERSLATALIAGVMTWFIIDGAGSIAAGAPMNAVFNTGFLALMLLPLFSGGRRQASS